MRKKEIAEIIDIIFTAILNLAWFGAWLYIIFIRGYSGWWILVPIFLHFKTDRAIEALNKEP